MKHLLFPTVIWQGNRNVTQQEKTDWFNAYLENSNEDGISMDFLGYQSFHKLPQFENIFKDIIINVNNYLDSLSIDKSNLQLYITKSWVNVKTTSGNPEHDHCENHISFTYYPHINEEYSNDLRFYRQGRSTPNEPYFGFLEDIITEWTPDNCKSFAIPISEGDIVVFPANLSHSTEGEDYMESFKTLCALQKSRFCVGGDILITRKTTEKYDKLLPPMDNWLTFNSL